MHKIHYNEGKRRLGDFMKKKWEFYDTDEELVQKLSQQLKMSNILTSILVNRNITSPEKIRIFLNPTRNDFYEPFLLNDMQIAVERILKAIEQKEKVMIYGDYDADGITSITVLKKFLEERGLIVDYYIPNRLEEGYGLNKNAIEKIAKQKYSLMITVDCGISAIEEIKLANKLGIETIITDHHETVEILPEAMAVVDPKRKDNTYPFRDLAGVGVVYKLIQASSIRLGLEEKEFLKYLDIVCIGTISDIVPLVDENRVIAKLGLKLIERTKNKGLKRLIEACNYSSIDANMISFGVAPRINACGRMGFQEEAIRLFLSDDEAEVATITQKLNEYNKERQDTEKKIFEEAISKIQKEKMQENNCIILGGENWHHGVIGIVSSKITDMYFKPSLLICFEGDMGKGSGRSIPGFDLHHALMETGDYLEKFGGHSMAVGLSVKKEKFEEFKKKFEELAKESNIQEIIPVIYIDEEITMKEMTLELMQELKQLEPFGEKNKEPLFMLRNVKIDSIRSLSEGKHIKLTLKEGISLIECIGFNLGFLAEDYRIGDKVDVVGNLAENHYQNQTKVQIVLQDIRKSYKNG